MNEPKEWMKDAGREIREHCTRENGDHVCSPSIEHSAIIIAKHTPSPDCAAIAERIFTRLHSAGYLRKWSESSKVAIIEELERALK